MQGTWATSGHHTAGQQISQNLLLQALRLVSSLSVSAPVQLCSTSDLKNLLTFRSPRPAALFGVFLVISSHHFETATMPGAVCSRRLWGPQRLLAEGILDSLKLP